MKTTPLPAKVRCTGTSPWFAARCPATPAQAYRLGHGDSAYWLARTCEVA